MRIRFQTSSFSGSHEPNFGDASLTDSWESVEMVLRSQRATMAVLGLPGTEVEIVIYADGAVRFFWGNGPRPGGTSEVIHPADLVTLRGLVHAVSTDGPFVIRRTVQLYGLGFRVDHLSSQGEVSEFETTTIAEAAIKEAQATPPVSPVRGDTVLSVKYEVRPASEPR
jgi:hypothetical protein